MPGTVLDTLIVKLSEYCSKAETKAQFESKVLAPAMRYLADKFSWSVRVFQIVAVLVFIQTLMLFWLLLRDIRRPAPIF